MRRIAPGLRLQPLPLKESAFLRENDAAMTKMMDGIAAKPTGDIDRDFASVVVADRWFPSSKTCSCCGSVKAELDLAQRVFRCGPCG
jgi:Putative transposase DNA-binding domain